MGSGLWQCERGDPHSLWTTGWRGTAPHTVDTGSTETNVSQGRGRAWAWVRLPMGTPLPFPLSCFTVILYPSLQTERSWRENPLQPTCTFLQVTISVGHWVMERTENAVRFGKWKIYPNRMWARAVESGCWVWLLCLLPLFHCVKEIIIIMKTLSRDNPQCLAPCKTSVDVGHSYYD